MEKAHTLPERRFSRGISVYVRLCSVVYVPTPIRASNERTVDEKQQDRPEYRCDKSGGIPWVIPSDRSTDESGECGSCKTNQHCDNDASGIAARHEELRESPDNQTDNQHP
jgi:hypothetical protein